jgi:hypothetical protein
MTDIEISKYSFHLLVVLFLVDRIQQKHKTEIQDLQTKYDLLLKRLEALENNK